MEARGKGKGKGRSVGSAGASVPGGGEVKWRFNRFNSRIVSALRELACKGD
jgi:hypothetical protein